MESCNSLPLLNTPRTGGWSRRAALGALACGFGQLAFAAMAGNVAGVAKGRISMPVLRPRAKRIIFLFMQGGPSQVDTFDYKPRLEKDDGRMLDFRDARTVANSGESKSTPQRVLKSPWKFRRHGASGQWVSELFPEMASQVDEMCFVRSLQTEGVAHGPASLFLHCGSTQAVRPSMGAWIQYGLGTLNENLPGFVTISPSAGNGGTRNFGHAFLPPMYQGTAFGRAGTPMAEAAIRNLKGLPGMAGSRVSGLIRDLAGEQVKRSPGEAELEAMVESYELAWRMQQFAPEVQDLSRESAATREMYGIGSPATDDFGRQCLLARRLCEAGVRHVQVTYGDNTANPAWDQHANLPKHADHARAVDKPVAGLLMDLKQRGLLDDTVVWWGGEFGRTPYAEKNGTGRDHNPGAFTQWLAGGGVRSGFALGETDEFGHRVVADRVHMHDLHATLLHLLGLDHEKLTFRHDGRDYRLTDVHGRVIREILA